MTSEDIQRIILSMERHGIADFVYESGETQLRLACALPAPAIEAQPAAPVAKSADIPAVPTVSSPCVGFFLFAHPASTEASPVLPRKAAKNEIVGYVKSAGFLQPVHAERDCNLVRGLVEDGAAVGYGTALFEIGA